MKLRVRFILFFIGSLFAFLLFTGLFVAVSHELVIPYFFSEEEVTTSFEILAILLPFLIGGILFGQYFVNPLVTLLSLIKELADGAYQLSEANQKLYTEKGRLKSRYFLYRELIADIDKLADQLAAAELERYKLEEAKTNWISGVSHDLKTPLSYITGYSSLLMDDTADFPEKERKRFVATIHDKSERINDLIGDLNLSFKLDALTTNFPLNKKEFDLNDFAKQLLVDFANNPKAEGYEFSFESNQESILFKADEKLLSRAIQNIVSNAINHNPVGTMIEISVEATEDQIIFSVRDDGVGMTDDTVEKLFDRYERPEETENTSGGLGLSVVKSIIDAHEGTIEVTSTVGQGTIFQFIFSRSF